MKKLVLLCFVAITGLFLTNCQRNQVLHSIKPPVESYATNESKVAPVPTQNTDIMAVSEKTAGNVSESLSTNTENTVSTPVIVASTKEARQQKQEAVAKKLMANQKVREFVSKVEIKKDAAGNQIMVAKEGKKLNMIEKMVVKKANKAAVKPNKGFRDWNKFLRWGIILLAVALLLSIINAALLYTAGLWILNSLVWLAGLILFWYGLGLELGWW